VRRTLLPDLDTVRRLVSACIDTKQQQGHETAGLHERLDAAPDSYDALLALAEQVASSPLREDWPYVEPDDLTAIAAECSPPTATPGPHDVAARIETAFLARVAGCILGKPFEFDPTLEELRGVLEPAGEWPLRDYVTEATNALLRAPQPQWPSLVRERITSVCEDDDLNYTVLAMLLLEQHGAGFTPDDVRRQWLYHLPVLATFGPERTQLISVAAAHMVTAPSEDDTWADVLNPYDEHCGALIRADAYGYACPGDPWRAATLAYRDAITTHRRTGVYATMFVAAAIATALVSDDRLAPFRTALQVVPARSRFAEIVRQSLTEVEAASDWLDGYARIHGRYAEYSHCQVYQEIGTLFVTARFARDVGDGIGMQVCQGNDTDSFGATAGSYLGALLGPDAFDHDHWLGRFNDRIDLALATFHETSLSALAARMGRLPERLVPKPSDRPVSHGSSSDSGTSVVTVATSPCGPGNRRRSPFATAWTRSTRDPARTGTPAAPTWSGASRPRSMRSTTRRSPASHSSTPPSTATPCPPGSCWMTATVRPAPRPTGASGPGMPRARTSVATSTSLVDSAAGPATEALGDRPFSRPAPSSDGPAPWDTRVRVRTTRPAMDHDSWSSSPSSVTQLSVWSWGRGGCKGEASTGSNVRHVVQVVPSTEEAVPRAARPCAAAKSRATDRCQAWPANDGASCCTCEAEPSRCTR
jgi:ADP-ribosylglycohydrolase